MHRRILIIEDDLDIAELIRINLRDIAGTIDVAGNAREGLEKARVGKYDLLILDLMLPGGMDGLEVCRRLRAREEYLPILMLTAKSAELDRVLGLELGADDYLTKPFSVLELVARVKALFRRVTALNSEGVNGEIIRTDGLLIDPARRRVEVEGRNVSLTVKEYDLLYYFAQHPGRVYNRAQLLDRIWGYGHEGYEHTVNSHINRLRAKIERDPANPRYILTVWGVGYKFADA
jgi:DNA-binding response OmpR family regulator